MVSALSGDGVADLRRFLAEHVPSGPWLYPEDQMSDAPLRVLAAELTREQLYQRTHQELPPYRLTVETDKSTESKDGSVRIEQTIFWSNGRASVKSWSEATGKPYGPLVQTLRQAIAGIINAPVHLFLFVKVREKWAEDPGRYREMGLDFPFGR